MYVEQFSVTITEWHTTYSEEDTWLWFCCQWPIYVRLDVWSLKSRTNGFRISTWTFLNEVSKTTSFIHPNFVTPCSVPNSPPVVWYSCLPNSLGFILIFTIFADSEQHRTFLFGIACAFRVSFYQASYVCAL